MAPVLIVATEQDEPESASPACSIPSGTAHALEPGAMATRCGLPAARLTTWPELSWPPPGMAAVDLCPACSAAG